MATPAAAALFAAALPTQPAAMRSSEASTSNHPFSAGNVLGRGRGRGNSRGRGASRRPGNGREDGDAMDVAEPYRRKGREGRKASGPMGERPSNDLRDRMSSNNSRNSPSVIRDGNKRASGSNAPPTASAIETLRLFLVSRYSEVDKMLNLENMAGDLMLIQAGLKAPGEKGAPTNVAGAMWKLAGGLFPEIISLSLANNGLTSILPLSPFLLTTHLPNILNVSFAANSLNSLRDIDPLSPSVGKIRGDGKSKGWSNLRELVLTGNPFVEGGAREAAYRSEIARRFPSLNSLDQKPLDPSIAFASTSSSNLTPGLSPGIKRESSKSKGKVVRQPVVFPVQVQAGFFESEGTRDFVAGFFMKYFPAFDTDRPSLIPAYNSTCSFSFFCDTSYPVRARAKKIGARDDKKFPFQSKLDWKQYLTPEGSRNLSRVKVPSKRLTTLQLTPSGVITSICRLPTTAHPLTDPTKFVFDTWTMPGVLAPTIPGSEGETVIFAVVHGEFTELPCKGIRSFTRSFILAPAAPGSPAQLAGWPCVILSDSFSVRIYSSPNAWAPKTESNTSLPATATAPLSSPAAGERADGLTDAQQALVLELQARTKLTYSFAHLCLVQNSWDPPKTWENFLTLSSSGSIPPEAFVL